MFPPADAPPPATPVTGAAATEGGGPAAPRDGDRILGSLGELGEYCGLESCWRCRRVERGGSGCAGGFSTAVPVSLAHHSRNSESSISPLLSSSMKDMIRSSSALPTCRPSLIMSRRSSSLPMVPPPSASTSAKSSSRLFPSSSSVVASRPVLPPLPSGTCFSLAAIGPSSFLKGFPWGFQPPPSPPRDQKLVSLILGSIARARECAVGALTDVTYRRDTRVFDTHAAAKNDGRGGRLDRAAQVPAALGVTCRWRRRNASGQRRSSRRSSAGERRSS